MKCFKNLLKKILGRYSAEPFVSDADQFIREFNKTHILSASQLAEIEKHERIARLRDNPVRSRQESDIWRDF